MTFEEEFKQMKQRLFSLENQVGFLTALLEYSHSSQSQLFQMRAEGKGIHCDQCNQDLPPDCKTCPAHDPQCMAGLSFLESLK